MTKRRDGMERDRMGWDGMGWGCASLQRADAGVGSVTLARRQRWKTLQCENVGIRTGG